MHNRDAVERLFMEARANHRQSLANTPSTASTTITNSRSIITNTHQPPRLPTRPHHLGPPSTPSRVIPTLSHPSIALSPTTNAGLAKALQHGLARSTQSNYDSTIARFMDFCDREGIAASLHFPAAEFVLCAFVGSFADSKSGQSAANAIAALKSWHLLNGQPWNGSHLLSHVIRGSNILTPMASRRPPRPPVTITMLTDLQSNLSANDPFDVAVLAAALTAFWGQCRLGELLGSSRTKHNPSCLPSRSSFRITSPPDLAAELLLPRTKTNQAHGQTVFLTSQRQCLSPIKAMENHLTINTPIPLDHHRFAFQSPRGPRCLIKEAFLTRCNQIWSTRGYPRITGHCFRIGGTHTYLSAGVPDDVVKMLGRWSSDSFLKYWRGMDQIAGMHVKDI
ncbi:hypothetical protein CTheo_7350 [Ceratobasidium theobromae]|uniref:Uncharacterized protein n=1 Tax=Ceratobasidium theobromae TaxID=1582974 RepID=A0A5N5QCZ5_9AGAM|nr:hypothetical protein CTheo_7350 [Ceratobasidium theobromae]